MTKPFEFFTDHNIDFVSPSTGDKFIRIPRANRLLNKLGTIGKSFSSCTTWDMMSEHSDNYTHEALIICPRLIKSEPECRECGKPPSIMTGGIYFCDDHLMPWIRKSPQGEFTIKVVPIPKELQ